MIPLAALGLSVLTFVAMQVQQTRLARKGHVDSIEERLVKCEAEKEGFRTKIDHLELRLFEVMSRLYDLGGRGVPPPSH